MARFPFVYNFNTARAYYGPSLEDPRKQGPSWTSAEQVPPYDESHGPARAISAALVGGGLLASGFLPYKGKRLWDVYNPVIRAVEEYSPGTILRTFQLSNFFSQFQTYAPKFIDPELLRANESLAEYYTKLMGGGPARQRLLAEGFTVRGGRAFWGQGEEQALRYASFITLPEGASAYLGSGWARTVGASEAFATRIGSRKIPYAHIFFSKFQPLKSAPEVVNPLIGSMPAQAIGGRTLPEYVARQAGAWGTEWVSRFNRLLRAPFEMEPFRSVFSTAQKGLFRLTGKRIELAVPEAAGMKMLGQLSLKYGAGLGAIALAYSTIDHLTREADILDGTMFESGLTAAGATLGVKANLIASEVADFIGLHKAREIQENIAPGSTSLQKLAAFPLLGAFGAGVAAYGTKAYLMGKAQRGGATAWEAREAAEKTMKAFGESGRLAALGRDITSTQGWYARQDRLGRLWRAIASPAKDGDLYFKLAGKLGPTKIAAIAGAAIGVAAVLPFVPGALIPETRPDELRAIYSGEQEVPIRKGRWWEFGRTPYEGGRIMYFRPHWYPRMLTRARERALWGEDEPTPLNKWLTKEFSYDLEERFYRERPYPITSVPFEDIPFIGPVLAGTIGRLIKPPMLMHTEEWASDKGVLGKFPRFGTRIATELGEVPGGTPVSPYGAEGVVGEQIYRMTEMIGLPGFSMVSMKEKITGTGDTFDQLEQLESARRMAGFERYYWDLELGGLLGSTEAFRRLYPHRRRQIPLYNPIRNTMPGWLPGPGDRSSDFLHGDPYTKVREGELRLPGEGYAARFPELEGVAPEEYPLIHKWKILSDIAPYSESYGQHLQMVRAARKTRDWSEYEENIYQQTIEQIKQKKASRIQLQEYTYLSPMGELTEGIHYAGEDSSDAIAALNRQYAEQREGDKGSLFDRLFGGYWEVLAHNADTAWDSLTPISPGAKLVHTRSPVEAYERLQLYGTENAFWQHPWRDFLRPFTALMGKSLGWSGVPGHIERKREVEEHFDVLKYAKYARLANIARFSGDTSAVKEFESKKDETLFGINPFTRNYTSIFRALPRRERDYFNAFSAAATVEERQRILEMVPENERALYVARWKVGFADEVKKAKKAGYLSEKEVEEAEDIVSGVYDEAKTEGLPTSKELFQEYLTSRIPGESYPDWYRRVHLLPQYPALPGPDWVGWHPSVDLEDIKLRVVQNLGEDMHDFNLWPSRLQALAYKPYINEAAIAPILQPEELTESQMRARIDELFVGNNMMPSVFTRSTFGNSASRGLEVNIEQRQDTEDLLSRIL